MSRSLGRIDARALAGKISPLLVEKDFQSPTIVERIGECHARAHETRAGGFRHAAGSGGHISPGRTRGRVRPRDISPQPRLTLARTAKPGNNGAQNNAMSGGSPPPGERP